MFANLKFAWSDSNLFLNFDLLKLNVEEKI